MSIVYEIEEDDRTGLLDFECEYCCERFYIDMQAYQGEWDHEPNVPVCPDCAEDE